MFTLNTPENAEALWQHALMFVISVAIGYVLGHIGNKQKEHKLEIKLAKLDSEIENYQLKKDLTLQNNNTNSKENPENKRITQIKTDDLKVIEGIDFHIEEQLNSFGIHTFQQLITTGPERIVEILQNSGISFEMHQPRTWPQQAKFAENKMWDNLAELQNELKKGNINNTLHWKK